MWRLRALFIATTRGNARPESYPPRSHRDWQRFAWHWNAGQLIAASLRASRTSTTACLLISGSVGRILDLLNASPAGVPPASGLGRRLSQTGNSLRLLQVRPAIARSFRRAPTKIGDARFLQ